MTRILMRSGKDPFTMVCAESTLEQDVFNNNTGNYLFAHSLYRALATPGTELVSNSTLSETREATERAAARVDEEFDAFVVPLANAFRPEFARRLDNLAGLVERLTIPVVVAGVGAQAPLDSSAAAPDALEEIAPVVKRFTRAVLDRSDSIGVRGEFTHDYLVRLGFPSSAVDVIGCPSVFLRGPDFRLAGAPGTLADEDRIALSLTDGVPGLGDLVAELAERHPRLVYVGQDKDDLRLMLWREAPDRPSDPGVPLHPGHRLVREDRVRFPVETWSWLSWLSGFDYAAGTRLHGAIAALLAGVPATLLCHDSRTWELARLHGLPHVRLDGPPAGMRLAEVYDAYDPAPFDAAYPGLFAGFTDFLERNGLRHVYADGGAEDFDAAVAALDPPEVLAPLTADNQEQLYARLRWLRDGTAFDSTLHPQALRHPFPFPIPPDQRTPVKREQRELRAGLREVSSRVRGAQQGSRAAERRHARQQQRLDRQAARLQRQTARLDRQAGRLDALEQTAARSWRRRLRRLLRGSRAPG